jgi:hypothetical protein
MHSKNKFMHLPMSIEKINTYEKDKIFNNSTIYV